MARKARQLPSGSWHIQIPEYKTWDESRGKWKYHMKSITAPTKKDAERIAFEWEDAHKSDGEGKFVIPDNVLDELPSFTRAELNRLIENGYSDMRGVQFEKLCYRILSGHGFACNLTKLSGDHGADIVATRFSVSYVFQCKRSISSIGYNAVKEAYTARGIYHADKAVVITNSDFTVQAILDAAALDVSLWGGDILAKLIRKVPKEYII